MRKYSLFLFFMAMLCKLHYSQNISSSTVLSSKTRINTHAVLVIGTHLSSSDDNVVEMNKIGDLKFINFIFKIQDGRILKEQQKTLTFLYTVDTEVIKEKMEQEAWC